MSRDLGVEMFVDFDQFVYGKGELELAARVEHLRVNAVAFLPNSSGSVSDTDHALRLAKRLMLWDSKLVADFIRTSWNLETKALRPAQKK